MQQLTIDGEETFIQKIINSKPLPTAEYSKGLERIMNAVQFISVNEPIVFDTRKGADPFHKQFELIMARKLRRRLRLKKRTSVSGLWPGLSKYVQQVVTKRDMTFCPMPEDREDFIIHSPFSENRNPDILIGLNGYLYGVECKCGNDNRFTYTTPLYPLFVYVQYNRDNKKFIRNELGRYIVTFWDDPEAQEENTRHAQALKEINERRGGIYNQDMEPSDRVRNRANKPSSKTPKIKIGEITNQLDKILA